MATNVGFIGLGYMGKGMAMCVVRAGFDTTVFDISPDPVEELVKLGAKAAQSVQQAATGSEVVIVMVRDDAQVEQVVLGDSGVLSALGKGSTIIVMSTVSQAIVRRIAREAGQKGVGMLDAPVTGQRREEGMLTIFVGGDESTFQQCKPLFDAMGSNIHHMGEVGTGEVAKLVNNAIAIGVMFTTTEALTLGVKSGVKLEKLLEPLQAPESAGNNWMVNNWDIISYMKRTHQKGSPLDLMYKDMSLFLGIAREIKLDLPVCSLVSNLDGSKLPEG